jgi:hypothetical protein
MRSPESGRHSAIRTVGRCQKSSENGYHIGSFQMESSGLIVGCRRGTCLQSFRVLPEGDCDEVQVYPFLIARCDGNGSQSTLTPQRTLSFCAHAQYSGGLAPKSSILGMKVVWFCLSTGHPCCCSGKANLSAKPQTQGLWFLSAVLGLWPRDDQVARGRPPPPKSEQACCSNLASWPIHDGLLSQVVHHQKRINHMTAARLRAASFAHFEL